MSQPTVSRTKTRAQLDWFKLIPTRFTPLEIVGARLQKAGLIRVNHPMRPKEVKWRAAAV